MARCLVAPPCPSVVHVPHNYAVINVFASGVAGMLFHCLRSFLCLTYCLPLCFPGYLLSPGAGFIPAFVISGPRGRKTWLFICASTQKKGESDCAVGVVTSDF